MNTTQHAHSAERTSLEFQGEKRKRGKGSTSVLKGRRSEIGTEMSWTLSSLQDSPDA